MWIVEDNKTGLIEAEFECEDAAWEHVMRFAINGNPYADRLEVCFIDDDNIDDLLAAS